MPSHPIVNRRSVPWGKRWSTVVLPTTASACQARARELMLSQASFVDSALQMFLQLTDEEIYEFMLTTKHLTDDEYAATKAPPQKE